MKISSTLRASMLREPSSARVASKSAWRVASLRLSRRLGIVRAAPLILPFGAACFIDMKVTSSSYLTIWSFLAILAGESRERGGCNAILTSWAWAKRIRGVNYMAQQADIRGGVPSTVLRMAIAGVAAVL